MRRFFNQTKCVNSQLDPAYTFWDIIKKVFAVAVYMFRARASSQKIHAFSLSVKQDLEQCNIFTRILNMNISQILLMCLVNNTSKITKGQKTIVKSSDWQDHDQQMKQRSKAYKHA